MESLRSVVDALAGEPGDPPTRSLYGDLAPVYEFVFRRRHDPAAIADFVDGHAPEDVRTVAVGACGPGHLLERLADRYPRAVGADLSPAMLDLAADRVGPGADLVLADLRRPLADGEFDLVTVLGNSVAHVPREDLAAVLSSARESLRPGGVFLADFTLASTPTDGHVTDDAFDSERFRVERRVETAVEDDAGGHVAGRYDYEFVVEDLVAGERARVRASTPVVAYRRATLLSAAVAAGFDEVATVRPPTPHGGGIVAERSE